MINKDFRVLLMLLSLIFIPATLLAVPSGQIITWEGGGQGTVRFEGDEHAEKEYKCESCHPSLFPMKKGSAKMTMNLLNNGRFCGSCHNGKVAFSTSDLQKCHECYKTKKRHLDHKDGHRD
jgi:c(7)-type cytochrome triheme protein